MDTTKKQKNYPIHEYLYLTIALAQEYEDWKAGLLMFDIQNDRFVSIDEGYEINENLEDEEDYWSRAISWDEYQYNIVDWEEMMVEFYTTPNEIELVAFGFHP